MERRKLTREFRLEAVKLIQELKKKSSRTIYRLRSTNHADRPRAGPHSLHEIRETPRAIGVSETAVG